MAIQKHRARPIQKQKDRADLFTAEKQAVFLGQFAATCNLQASARVAGVSHKTVYNRRYSDPAFRDAFAAAEEHGVVTLRAEMVRRSLQLMAAVTPDEKALAELPGLDCRTILHLLKYHEKGLGKGPGERRPERSDPGEAAARLHKLMERMRAEHDRDVAAGRVPPE